jgi:hypothetical protein
MLRNPLDQTNPVTSGAELTALIDGKDPSPRPVATTGGAQVTRATARVQPATPAPATLATAPVYTVEVFRAGKLTTETVQ